MTTPNARAALEQHLAALSPELPTAFENEDFDPATDASPYQEAYVMWGKPTTVGLVQRSVISRGIFQLNLCYPASEGVGGAEARGKAIADHFDPSTTVLDIDDGKKVRIIGRAVVGAPLPGRPGRYVVPLSIRFIVN